MDVRIKKTKVDLLNKNFVVFQNPWQTFAISEKILKDAHFVYDSGSELLFTNDKFVPLFSLYGCSYNDFENAVEQLETPTQPSFWTRVYEKWVFLWEIWETWGEMENESDDLLIQT